ncbi:MAG: YbjN domain-containing protein [Bacteroidales bacterium]|nr:YbjN domain-containing protein [Bacteroidales bacterium]
MKKLVIAVALLFAAAFCASAQNLSVLSKAARMAYDFLQKEGYKPYLDEDDDVVFTAEGYSFYIDNTPDDDTYLGIVMPYLMEVDSDNIAEVFAAMAACNEITREKKLVQAYISDDGDVMFCADTYIGSSGNMNEFLDTAIGFMIRGLKSFGDLYNEYMDD